MIKKAIDLGVAKINVNTECQLVFADATREYIEAGKDREGKGYDPRKLLKPGYEAIIAKVKEKYLNRFAKRDIYFILGTTLRNHYISKNPFIIIGVFYPPMQPEWQQISLFDL